jgi:hypothetical protein
MSLRIAHRLPRTTGQATCNRCLDVIDVKAGHWIAAEPDATHLAICNTCAQHDDPAGYAALTAWRRAANRPALGTKGRP